MANGSCNEVHNMLYIGLDFKHFEPAKSQQLFDLANEIDCILNGFSKSIKDSLMTPLSKSLPPPTTINNYDKKYE